MNSFSSEQRAIKERTKRRKKIMGDSVPLWLQLVLFYLSWIILNIFMLLLFNECLLSTRFRINYHRPLLSHSFPVSHFFMYSIVSSYQYCIFLSCLSTLNSITYSLSIYLSVRPKHQGRSSDSQTGRRETEKGRG